jgi:acyl-CoA dehydrogenase
VLNGAKTFIASGIQGDLVIVAATTDPDAGSRGQSLFVVERETPGFERGRKLNKIGLMEDYPIGRAYRDTRLTTIYGGTAEIMKLIIGWEIVGRP